MAKPRVRINPTRSLHLSHKKPGMKPSGSNVNVHSHGSSSNTTIHSSSHVANKNDTKHLKANDSKVANSQSDQLSKKQKINVTKKGKINSEDKAKIFERAKQKIDKKIEQKELKQKAKAAVNAKLNGSANNDSGNGQTAKGKGILSKVASNLTKATNKLKDNDLVRDTIADKVNQVTDMVTHSSDTDDFDNHIDDASNYDEHDYHDHLTMDVHNDNSHHHSQHHLSLSSSAHRSGLMAEHPVDASHHEMTLRSAQSEWQSTPPYTYNSSLGVGSRGNCSNNVGCFTDEDSNISLAVNDVIYGVIEKYDSHASLSELQRYRATINQKLSPYFNRCGITSVESFLDLLDIIYDPRNRKLFNLFRSLK